MFRIALTAGHYLHTAGKRCLKSLDPNETREWVLNDRIADKVEKLLQDYTGYELIRTDDTSGEKKITVAARTIAANNWGADFYLSLHHNAGINGGKGGGIVAYAYTNASKESLEWQKDLYKSLIESTGLKGNRADPMPKAGFAELRDTKMPAVLLELGFMDSATDVPVILSEEYANQCAEAIVKVLVERGGLERKAAEGKKLYRVQVGAFSNPNNAQAMLEKLKNAGFEGFITEKEN
jgi:N-acetylmuramoyl-L-alanine amidase